MLSRKIRLMSALSISTVLVACTVASEWERFYSAGTAAENRLNWVADLESDSYGDVLIAGSTVRPGVDRVQNTLLVKYNASGQRLWAVEKDLGNGQRSDDKTTDLVVDSAGNSYLIGVQYQPDNGSTGYGSFLMKVSRDGSIVWNRSVSNQQDAFSLQLAQDKLYLTGSATQVFDLNGQPLLKIPHTADTAWAIDTDINGNMVVAGSTGVAKYAANGQLVWRLRTAAGTYQQAAVRFNQDGSVVLGQSLEESGAMRISHVSATGQAEWSKTFTAARKSYGLPGPVLLGLDNRGDIYAVASNADGRRMVKLDSLGRTLWNQTRSGVIAQDLDVTADGKVYVVGGGINEKRDSNGKLLGDTKASVSTDVTTGAGVLVGDRLYAVYSGLKDGGFQFYLAQYIDR